MGWHVSITSYTPAPGCPTLLGGFSCDLEPGKVTHVCGPSGCGKSTLLAVLAGELPRHNGDDTLEADLGGFPCERARRTCQDPSMELACATVADELLLEPEYREPAWESALERALQTAAAARLGDWLTLPVPWLSYGQARLVGLASMLQYPPPAVLLDEPFAGLDEQGRAQVELAIARVAAAGSAVVVTHTRTVEASRVVFLAQAEPLPAPPLPVDVAPAVSGGLLARGLVWCGWAGSPGLDLRLEPGRLLLVTGPNGSGKTQLLMCLAGLRPPGSGNLRLTGSTAFVPQNPDQELSASRLLDQLTMGEQRLEKSAVALASWFGLDCAAAPIPFAMSFGEKRRICLAGALLRRPSVLLLDEPLNGLDATHRLRLLAALRAFVDGGGSAIVATHEPEPFAPLTPPILRLDPANCTAPWSLARSPASERPACGRIVDSVLQPALAGGHADG